MYQDEALALFETEADTSKQKKLCILLNDCQDVIAKKEPTVFNDDNKAYDGQEYFTKDGFWSVYFSSNPKVRFIGRESRYSSGVDRVQSNIENLKKILIILMCSGEGGFILVMQ